MAGQNTRGLDISQARAVHVSKLSHNPLKTKKQYSVFVKNHVFFLTLAIFAKVFASSGAIRNISAHFPSSIWRTGSPRFDHDAHSSSSLKICTFSGKSARLKKCSAHFVVIIRTYTRIYSVSSCEYANTRLFWNNWGLLYIGETQKLKYTL